MNYQPLHRHRPAHKWSNGDLAAKLGADIGLPPDEEQRWLLETIYAEVAAERPASFEVVVVAPRQNIKTSTFGMAALADLLVFGVERHLWTAHHGDTLKGTFTDFRAWLGSNRDYDERVTYFEGHQDMSIVETETGNRIDFQSRTGKAGRGLTGVKRITLDEALFLEPKHVGAVYPTMLTRSGAQVRISSSAGLLTSGQLRGLRDRGRTGRDHRLAYVEYGAERRRCVERDCRHAIGSPGCVVDDRDLWWAANCALWAGRIDEDAVADQRRALPPDEFTREFLSWWQDPVSVGGALNFDAWAGLADPGAKRGVSVVFGADVAEDRTGSVAVAWRRPDGAVHVMLTDDGVLSPVRTAARLVDVSQRWDGRVMLGGPAVELQAELEQAGVECDLVSSQQFAAGCGLVADAVRDRSIRHGNQLRLNEAVRFAQWRPADASGGRAWKLSNAPTVGPLAAVTRALFGLIRIPVPVPPPMSVGRDTGRAGDLFDVNF